MTSLVAGGVTVLTVFAAALGGMLLGRRLPRHHLGAASHDVVKLVLGIVATLSALVLGLLVASGKSSWDAQQGALYQMTAKLVEVDRVLAAYGPEASSVRAILRQAVEQELREVEPLLRADPAGLLRPRSSLAHLRSFTDAVQALTPEREGQRFAQRRALELVGTIAELRHLAAQQLSSPIPVAFLAVLIAWLSILFCGFGLFAPANATVVGALLLGAFSVAAAVFLVMELGRPYDGIMQISRAPLQAALLQLGR
jgi:hypothetical protein